MRQFRSKYPGMLVTSVRLQEGPAHDDVHVWNRGGKAGVLTVSLGDGIRLVERLFEPNPYIEDKDE